MSPSTAAHLLTRHSHRRRGAPPLDFLGELAFDRARVHEFCGTSRRTLALALAGALAGPVLWIKPSWVPGRVNPEGILRFVDPSRLIFVTPKRPEDILWTMEEALRAGLLALVVGDLPACPSLTAVRRLHLAAETGAAKGEVAPIGLLLTPGEGGAPGVETRWSMMPAHGTDDAEAWRLDRLRARTLPEKRWRIEGGAGGLKPPSPEPASAPA